MAGSSGWEGEYRLLERSSKSLQKTQACGHARAHECTCVCVASSCILDSLRSTHATARTQLPALHDEVSAYYTSGMERRALLSSVKEEKKRRKVSIESHNIIQLDWYGTRRWRCGVFLTGFIGIRNVI